MAFTAGMIAAGIVCRYRMYASTGDRDHLLDPVFLELCRRARHEHVERWDLASGLPLVPPRGILGLRPPRQ
jgi:hypothetical protein